MPRSPCSHGTSGFVLRVRVRPLSLQTVAHWSIRVLCPHLGEKQRSWKQWLGGALNFQRPPVHWGVGGFSAWPWHEDLTILNFSLEKERKPSMEALADTVGYIIREKMHMVPLPFPREPQEPSQAARGETPLRQQWPPPARSRLCPSPTTPYAAARGRCTPGSAPLLCPHDGLWLGIPCPPCLLSSLDVGGDYLK